MVWKIRNHNEYEPLKHVVVCSPRFLSFASVGKEGQMVQTFNLNRALEQHQAFIKTLTDYLVWTSSLSPQKDAPEQPFTRDAAFVIGDTVFLGNLTPSSREMEQISLAHWLSAQGIPYRTITEGFIAGGDVIADGKDVYVGIGKRTTMEAFHHLSDLLSDYTCHALPLRSDIQRLDDVFMPFSKKEALLYPDAFRPEDAENLQRRFDCIPVTAEEQSGMGTHILCVNQSTIFSSPQHTRINQSLRQKGYRLMMIPFDEVAKLGGSFHRCLLPLARKPFP